MLLYEVNEWWRSKAYLWIFIILVLIRIYPFVNLLSCLLGSSIFPLFFLLLNVMHWEMRCEILLGGHSKVNKKSPFLGRKSAGATGFASFVVYAPKAAAIHLMFIVLDARRHLFISSSICIAAPISTFIVIAHLSWHLPYTFELTFWLCENCMENAKSRGKNHCWKCLHHHHHRHLAIAFCIIWLFKLLKPIWFMLMLMAKCQVLPTELLHRWLLFRDQCFVLSK